VTDAQAAGLAIFVLVAALWITQALPLAVTALLVPLLAVLADLQQPREAFAPFAHPIVFLFLGGFALAAAVQKHGLDRALAGLLLRLAGGRRLLAVLLMAGATAVLSMWMSNTAAAVLMLPLALGLIASEQDSMGSAEQSFVLLAMTYSTALGGMASIVSTPPTAMAAAAAGVGFGEWFRMVAPVSALLWVVMLGVLHLTLRPRLAGRIAPAPAAFAWTWQRVITAVIFAATVAGWVAGARLGDWLGVPADMHAVVALAAIVALVATRTLHWSDFEREVQWSVLLLFGGGLALGELMGASGASAYLVQGLLAWVQGAPPLLVLLAIVASVVLLSELMSNTASAALSLPLFVPLAAAMGLSPVAMAIAIALSACCGFMLPVATPPNALVFGTGRIRQATMMRCGWRLDLACILGVTAAAHWLWR
jgi:solute carrier family 13 (sodium-dependent dicarboxylate transporter), member 2/3/5